MNKSDFDVIVIGAGPVGENAGQYATEGGFSVALVEHELMGGECSYYACMPSKSLLRPIQIVDTTRALTGISKSETNVTELLKRRDSWVSHYRDKGQVKWAESAGLSVFRGHGALIGEKKVLVTSGDEVVELTAHKAVIIATGSTAKIPPLYRDLLPWDNRDATGIVEVPESIAIIGGGVVAVEAATWLQALGSQVSLMVRGDHLVGALGSEVEGLSSLLQENLEEAGVRVLLETSVESASREDAEDTGLGRIHGGDISLALSNGEELTVSEILVATGRAPALKSIGLENLGLSPQDVLDGALPDWLFAIGDAGGKTALTHQGKYEARILGSKLAGKNEFTPTYVPTPQVIFTNPQIAQVGLTSTAAQKQGYAVLTVRANFNEVAGALLLADDTTGFAELVVEAGTGRILGATFVSNEVADLLHAATVAVLAELPVKLLRHAVPAYPTSSEIWLRLLEKLPRELR